MSDATMRDRPGAGWGWTMALGILSVVLGIVAILSPVSATFTATLLLGTFLIAAGVVSIGAGVVGRGHGRETYLLLYGILTLIVGLLIAFYPLSGAVAVTFVIAVWLAVRGVLEIVASRGLARGRGMLLALGIINLVIAVLILASLLPSSLVLPGYLLGFGLLLGGITEITAARAHRAGAPAFG